MFEATDENDLQIAMAVSRGKHITDNDEKELSACVGTYIVG